MERWYLIFHSGKAEKMMLHTSSRDVDAASTTCTSLDSSNEQAETSVLTVSDANVVVQVPGTQEEFGWRHPNKKERFSSNLLPKVGW